MDGEILGILRLLDECLYDFENIQKQIEDLQSLIGICSYLASTGLISTAINTGIASSQASSIYGNFNSDQRLTDLKYNPASYKKPPMNKMLGDIGELVVLQMLLEDLEILSESEREKILNDIQIKPKFAGTKRSPDFYIPSLGLICDAKAYTSNSVRLNFDKLITTIKDYANLLNGKGKVKLYFPQETYQHQEKLLKSLESEINGVKVRIMPMSEEHEFLVRRRELIYLLFKSKMIR